MPRVPFDQLPDDSRIWVFAADRPVRGEPAQRLLGEVDRFLEQWKAHGEPLRAAREWRDDHFLVVGVDPTTTNASGCSIDGMFRTLRSIEGEVGASIVGAGRVHYRAGGEVKAASREEFKAGVTSGSIPADATVFDPGVTKLADWRERFEKPMRESWAGKLVSL